jgi:hypothetical protein
MHFDVAGDELQRLAARSVRDEGRHLVAHLPDFPLVLVHLLLMIIDTATAFPSSSVCLSPDASHLHPEHIWQSLPRCSRCWYFHSVPPCTARQRNILARDRSLSEYVYDVFAFEDLGSGRKSKQGWECCSVHAPHQRVPGPSFDYIFPHVNELDGRASMKAYSMPHSSEACIGTAPPHTADILCEQ